MRRVWYYLFYEYVGAILVQVARWLVVPRRLRRLATA